MKLHHLRTAFLVICLLLVCSQGRSQNNNDGDVINDTINNNVVANFTNTHINPIINIDTTTNNTFNSDIQGRDLIINDPVGNFSLDPISGTSGIDPILGSDFINPINNNVVANFTNTHINTDIIINTDPAVPEPTTLSLLAMSLLFAGRRWR